jgi:hypothetical protein
LYITHLVLPIQFFIIYIFIYYFLLLLFKYLFTFLFVVMIRLSPVRKWNYHLLLSTVAQNVHRTAVIHEYFPGLKDKVTRSTITELTEYRRVHVIKPQKLPEPRRTTRDTFKSVTYLTNLNFGELLWAMPPPLYRCKITGTTI